jgi:hypothetical protein
MAELKRTPRKRLLLDGGQRSVADDDVVPEQPTRHYDSGRNTDMQAQRSNRQGSGAPTQQRTDDR